MGAMPNEPSMEEILSSIKRIIAEEDSPGQPPRAPRRAAVSIVPPARTEAAGAAIDAADDQVLELTDALPGESAAEEEEPAMAAAPTPTPAPTPAPAPARQKAESKGGAARARAAAPPPAAPPMEDGAPATVMSDAPANAARESLIALSQLLVRPEDGTSNTLEGLVREMLRPMLKEWLDARLPNMVEAMVKREIDRITGRV